MRSGVHAEECAAACMQRNAQRRALQRNAQRRAWHGRGGILRRLGGWVCCAADVPKKTICSSRLTEASAAAFRKAVLKHYWCAAPGALCCRGPLPLMRRRVGGLHLAVMMPEMACMWCMRAPII
jgi:hypothetical protein